MTGLLSLGDWMSDERRANISHGVYYWSAIMLTYNSNHMEGSTLSQRQTQQLFDSGSVTPDDLTTPIRADDVVETQNHFNAFAVLIDRRDEPLSHELVKQLHGILKAHTGQSRNQPLWQVGDYKRHPNQIGLFDPVRTTPPDRVESEMAQLFDLMNGFTGTDAQFAEFHATFERIHPFSDGNGRIGRLLMFKEALRLGVLPPLVFDDEKSNYIEALSSWHPRNPQTLATFIHHSRQRYRSEILDRFDAGQEFTYKFTSVPDMQTFESQTITLKDE
ncbi:Fic family protein [Bifidobacterium sp.]|uniref:Fic family protein n=1 Tax=Bifidobacterium sp. TaxID=41200 RepID=UPI0025C172A8|nr:Fic family protein [Bifidobacterium sp.]MCI1635922.1 Fic family protein [Bifidobacterium sp.]